MPLQGADGRKTLGIYPAEGTLVRLWEEARVEAEGGETTSGLGAVS